MNQVDMLKPSKRERQKRRDKRLKEELIECYRYGSSDPTKRKGYKKRFVGQDFEKARNKEGIKLMSGGWKTQTDNLNPMIRFLEKSQGKFWDKVYSELCRTMDKNSVLGQHVFDHMWDFVVKDVYIENGRIYGFNKWGEEGELMSSRWRPRYYVHPKSGVLLKVKKRLPKGTMYYI